MRKEDLENWTHRTLKTIEVREKQQVNLLKEFFEWLDSRTKTGMIKSKKKIIEQKVRKLWRGMIADILKKGYDT